MEDFDPINQDNDISSINNEFDNMNENESAIDGNVGIQNVSYKNTNDEFMFYPPQNRDEDL